MYLKKKSSARLNYRELDSNDELYWVDFLNSNQAMKFMPELPLSAEERAKSWIDSQLLRYDQKQFGLLALIERGTNNFLGQCGLLTQEIDGLEELEIGYHLLPDQWHKGLAIEAAIHMKEYAFDNLDISSIISIIHIDNLASQKNLLKKME